MSPIPPPKVLLSLGPHGYIHGIPIFPSSPAPPTNGVSRQQPQQPLCTFYGGIPYGLSTAGPHRWRRPRPLPPDFSYGTRTSPGGTGTREGCRICPQQGRVDADDEAGVSEDCLQCNVWVPRGAPPVGGWAVLIFIHGGFLQFGTANDDTFAPLIGETAGKCIVVQPAYRLNVYGFLACSDLADESGNGSAGNYGFWDQRLAIEWCRDWIHYFGGKGDKITVGGQSAGAHSAFQQLSHDLHLPASRALIKRALLFSNGPGIQPRSIASADNQYRELLHYLGIPFTLSAPERLSQLRSTSPARFAAAIADMKIHQFRGVSDDAFVSSDLFSSLDDGRFAARLRERNIPIIFGEVRDEHTLYATWRPPEKNTMDAVRVRLEADYPAAHVAALLRHFCPANELPPGCENWDHDAFGRLYAAVQVYATQRGLARQLIAGGAGELVHRYRVEWMPKFLKHIIPPEMGVTHGSDLPIWLWGNGGHLTKSEKVVIRESFGRLFWTFLTFGRGFDWGTGAPRDMRRLNPEGRCSVAADESWDDGCDVWDVLRGASEAVAADEARNRPSEAESGRCRVARAKPIKL